MISKEKWWIKLLRKLGIIKYYEVDKKEMCKKAVDSNVCPKSCNKCAWNTLL